jgi:hypothetical protein
MSALLAGRDGRSIFDHSVVRIDDHRRMIMADHAGWMNVTNKGEGDIDNVGRNAGNYCR